MPSRLRTPCTYPGCDQLTDGGRCLDHRRQAEKQRGTFAQRGYRAGHQRFRKAVLARDVVCRSCKAALSTVADHHPLGRNELIDAGKDPDDPQHGRGLCASCHGKETQANPRQRGGWNQPR